MKCDLGYQERFDNAIPAVRQTFVEALAAVSEDDFTKPLPVLGLIALLNESEFEDFIVGQTSAVRPCSGVGDYSPFIPRSWILVFSAR